MLSMSGMSGGQGGYYTSLASVDDYYTEGGEPPGVWRGRGAEALGLVGKVDTEAFHHLFQGYTPDGTAKLVQSAGRENHRPGWDLTFSAPKSVSTLWSQADAETRHAIQQAHQEAITAALGYLEQEAGVTRRGKGGEHEEKAKLVVALFEHGTSRAQDPQLHTHALVLNLGLREDGTCGTLESKHLYQHKMTAGALYRAELSALLEAGLGLQSERVKSWFELAGVPKPLTETFSTRRQEIEALMERMGYDGAKASALAALATREVKGHVARAELFGEWQKVGEALGWHKTEVSEFLMRCREEQRQAPSRDVRAEAEQCLTRAMDKLTEQHSHFSERELLRAAFEDAQGRGVAASTIQAEARALLTQPHLMRVGTAGGETRYTTQSMWQLEQKLLDGIDRLQANAAHSLPTPLLELSAQTLSSEQAEALRHITQNAGAIQCVVGMAGTGKTRMLAAAREAWEAGGYQVVGTALAGKAAEGLQQEASIASATAAATLLRIEKGQMTLTARTVLVVDEAGMMGTRQMEQLVAHVQEARAKLVLVGDPKQLQPIEAGGPFKAIAERVGAAELVENRRQRADATDRNPLWRRDTVQQFASGDAQTALHAYAERGLLHIADDAQQARERLITDWKQAGAARPHENLIITNTRLDVTILNRLAQAERQKAGALGEETIAIGGETVHTGERVLFTQNSNRYGVKNGNLATVEKIDLARQTLTVTLDGRAERITIPLEHYQEIKLGYAITTHKGQGVTVENAFVLVGGGMQDLHQTYVQMSRTRGDTRLYTDQMEAGENMTDLVRAMSRTNQKDLAHTVRRQEDALQESQRQAQEQEIYQEL